MSDLNKFIPDTKDVLIDQLTERLKAIKEANNSIWKERDEYMIQANIANRQLEELKKRLIDKENEINRVNNQHTFLSMEILEYEKRANESEKN